MDEWMKKECKELKIIQMMWGRTTPDNKIKFKRNRLCQITWPFTDRQLLDYAMNGRHLFISYFSCYLHLLANQNSRLRNRENPKNLNQMNAEYFKGNFKEPHQFELRGPATLSWEVWKWKKRIRRQSTRKKRSPPSPPPVCWGVFFFFFGPAGRRREVRPWEEKPGEGLGKGNAPCTLGRVLCVQQEEQKFVFLSFFRPNVVELILFFHFPKHSSEIFKWNLFFLLLLLLISFGAISFPSFFSSFKVLVHLSRIDFDPLRLTGEKKKKGDDLATIYSW